jgi:glycosyltransferase involved in cell wall biosynthesis
MRLLCLSTGNPRDIRQWSGIPYFLFDALQRRASAGGWNCGWVSAGVIDVGARALNRMLRRFAVPIDCRFSRAYAVLVGVVLTLRLAFVGNAVLVAVAASNWLAYVRTRHKVIYLSDATFHEICRLYPLFQAFPDWLKRSGDRNERRALERASHVIYTSRWAAQSAERDYGLSADRITLMPFGPNIPTALIEQYSREKDIDAASEIVLLFLSADWQRKNGALAISVGEALGAAGFKVRLILVGDIPGHARGLPFTDVRGVLRKSNPQQLVALCEAFAEAHFLLLTSIADATPVICSEAQAFGVPSIAYDVGGVGSAVIDGMTGCLLPPGAGAERFAAAIIACARDRDAYRRLSANCRDRYRRQANWDAWAHLIFGLADELCARPAALSARDRLPAR